jgi:hypothetical protein
MKTGSKKKITNAPTPDIEPIRIAFVSGSKLKPPFN